MHATLDCIHAHRIYTVGPVIIEFFRVEIGQFKISSDKFAKDSGRFKKVQPKFFVAIQKAMLNFGTT